MLLNAQQITTLLQVSRELAGVGRPAQALGFLLDAVVDLTNSDAASVLEYDESIASLRFASLMPPQLRRSLEGVSVPVQGSIAGLAFREKRPVLVSNVAESPHRFKGIDYLSGYQTHSVVAVPILLRNEALGVLEALNKRDGSDYTGDDVAILEALASQVAFFLENQRLRQVVQKNQEDTERLNRMKSDFIAITSHELRTPLGLILGHSTFLREIIDQEYHDQLDTIVRNATRIKEIIESTTSVNNVQTGTALVHRESVSVRKIIQDAVETLSEDARRKKLNFRVEIGRSDLWVEGDAEKIGIILSNLIKNAITFTNENGHVLILAEQIPGYVKVSVIDNGIGIPAADMERIFERFYQVESHLTRRHGGMGLGLSVAKMLVELQGGKIWVESVEGKGSNFTVLLPMQAKIEAKA